MKRKRLLIDADEVLADFQLAIFELAEKLFGHKLTSHNFDTWDIFGAFPQHERDALFDIIEKPGFCKTIRPVPGALEAVQELRKHVDVHPVTSPFSSSTWVSERYAWLHDEFGFKRKDIVFTQAKFLVNGDALLDDSPKHVTSWLEEYPEKMGMLWHIPNTRTLTQYDHLRVKSWGEVIQKVKAL